MEIFGGIRAQKAMCAYAFHALEAHSKEWKPKYPITVEEVPTDVDMHGMFVTFKKDNKLRGCVGSFRTVDLQEGLMSYGVAAGSQDSRFSPIAPNELTLLDCEVTTLSPKTKINHWEDWFHGVHGLHLQYTEDGKQHSSTFLPDVILNQGWTKRQTFNYLLAKAGCRARATPEVLSECIVHTYESSKEVLSYREYHDLYRTKWGFLPL